MHINRWSEVHTWGWTTCLVNSCHSSFMSAMTWTKENRLHPHHRELQLCLLLALGSHTPLHLWAQGTAYLQITASTGNPMINSCYKRSSIEKFSQLAKHWGFFQEINSRVFFHVFMVIASFSGQQNCSHQSWCDQHAQVPCGSIDENTCLQYWLVLRSHHCCLRLESPAGFLQNPWSAQSDCQHHSTRAPLEVWPIPWLPSSSQLLPQPHIARFYKAVHVGIRVWVVLKAEILLHQIQVCRRFAEMLPLTQYVHAIVLSKLPDFKKKLKAFYSMGTKPSSISLLKRKLWVQSSFMQSLDENYVSSLVRAA